MNFLNPFILFGLAAAGVPLLLHLLSRRRARMVPFPSIHLMSLLESDRIRMLRFKQLLLLILRTLIILLIVTGFARPALRSVFRAGARTSAVIIIDNSASMTVIEDGESLFGRAKRLASEILSIMREGDTAAVSAVAGDQHILDPGSTGNMSALTELVSDMEPLHTEGDPTAAISAAVDLLSSTKTVNREIYYLTDGAVNALPDSIPGNGDSDAIRLYTITVGSSQRDGAVVNNLSLSDKIVVPGKALTCIAEGVAGADDTEVEVSFFINGERKHKETVVPSADRHFSAECVYTPEEEGWIEVAASAGDNGYEDGETRRLVVRTQEPVSVLIVSGEYTDGYFLQRMISNARTGSAFTTSVVSSEEATPEILADADVVVLSGVRDLADDVYRELVSSVMDRGRGLIIIPPERSLSTLYKEGIFRKLFPLDEYTTVSLDTRDGLRYTVMDRYDYTHPVMRGISQRGEFTYPEVTSYLSAIPAAGARVFARYNDGTMAAGDIDCGNGRVVLYTGDVAALTGELAFTGIFIPMFIRSVQYLSDTLPERAESVTGRPVMITFPDTGMTQQVTVKHADNPAVRVAYDQSGARTTVNGYIPENPGFYMVAADGKEKERIAVNISRDEAVFRRAGNETFEDAFQTLSWQMLDEDEDIDEAVNRDRFGTELAGLFLGIALMLLAIEMVIARKA